MGRNSGARRALDLPYAIGYNRKRENMAFEIPILSKVTTMHCVPAFLIGLALRAVFAACLLFATGAYAQYPTKPIRMVVPFPPGGSADVIARSIAQSMSQGLDQPVVVENKTGADGMIAGEAVMKAAPDGYTLIFATNTAFNAAPVMHKAITYDPVADFTPVGRVGTFGFFVFVHEGLPARTLAQLFEYARANPGKLSYGSGNSTSIIATARLAQEARLDMTHVPYRGEAPMTLDLLAGRVQVAVATGTLLQHAKDGKLRVLVTLLPNRAAVLPDVPTLVEVGVRAMPMTSWAGIFGPAKMPRPIVERLARELSRALAQPGTRDQLEKLAFEPQSSTPEELGEIVRVQLEIWRKSVRDAGLAAQ